MAGAERIVDSFWQASEDLDRELWLVFGKDLAPRV
jgi:hypothetical protein